MTNQASQRNAVAWDEGNRSARRRLNVEPSECWPKWTRDDYNVAARKANELFASQIGAKSTDEADILAALNERHFAEEAERERVEREGRQRL